MLNVQPSRPLSGQMAIASLLWVVPLTLSSWMTAECFIRPNVTTVSAVMSVTSALCIVHSKYLSHNHMLQLITVYVFPGVGLGVTVVGAKTVTDKMLYVAAEALANFVPSDELAAGRVFPHINNIRHVSHRIAVAVAEEAIRTGQATKATPEAMENLPEYVASKMYFPQYVPLIEKREVSI